MSENGEIYTIGNNLTLPLALLKLGQIGSVKKFLKIRRCKILDKSHVCFYNTQLLLHQNRPDITHKAL